MDNHGKNKRLRRKIKAISLDIFITIVKQVRFQNADNAEEKNGNLLNMKWEIIWRWYQ